jgi:protein-S-isoprenylcysteine O-methyltransferase Ste14
MNVFSKNRRAAAVIGTVIFLFVAPGFFSGVVPWWICRWRVHASFPGFAAVRAAGALLMLLALAVLLDSFVRFALEGMGTPAPVFPTERLVVSGFYRYVRNPMYVAVVALVLGQGLFFGDMRVIAYGLCAWLVTHVFVLLYEEPTMRRTFPADYAVFSAHVPRWIPRLRPWQGNG